MHDLKFANEIITVLKSYKKNLSKDKHITVNVSLSPLSHVKPEGLKETFAVLLESEKDFKDARLVVSPLELELWCRKCNAVSKSIEPLTTCPRCGSGDLDIQTMREFRVDSIEIETL